MVCDRKAHKNVKDFGADKTEEIISEIYDSGEIPEYQILLLNAA